jgi:hypothetical protein
VLSRKVSKFSITSVLCAFLDSIPVTVGRVLRDCRLLETEYGINVLLSSWFTLKFWFVASIRWMKC